MTETAKPIDPSALPYRPCVGIMLINAGGLVWIGRRRDSFAENGGNWQMPQGGIDAGEDPAAAARRELTEETGTAQAEILAELRGWLHYDLPVALIGPAFQGRYRGQRQKWFAMRYLGSDDDFNIHAPHGGTPPEFDAWRWETASELPALIVPFKQKIYEAVVEEFGGFLR